MKLYNSLTRTVEEFVPRDPSEVKIYTCGPTVYHFAHIGNLRSYLMEDLLVRALKFAGYNVKRVMNITDVGHLSGDADEGEDKMIVGAKREHKSVKEIAEFYTQAFFEDIKALNILMPDVVEPATNCIDSYIKIISGLLGKGFAYQAGGNVYFDTSKLEKYHIFYSFDKDDLKVGVRDSVDEDKSKRSPNDFVLWFTKSKFENQSLLWDSPWGVGYPGWHIECSGIALKHLGEYVDIHCGGIDNAFPHHTNEVAQSEAYLGHEWCHTWIHVLHLVTNSGKMSKSSGEFLTLKVFCDKGYTAMEYRFFCLESHYRKPLVFSYDIIDNSARSYKKLLRRVAGIKDEGEMQSDKFAEYREKFLGAINDDLNSSMTLTILFDVLKDENVSGKTKLALVKDFDEVLALDLLAGEQIQNEITLTDEEILEKISQRAQAKQAKDYATADKIREYLSSHNVSISDTKDGTTFTRI